MFGIFPEEMPKTIEGESVLPASIVIDGFKESITIPLIYWNIDDYRNSWLKSLKEGLANKNHAALVVSMYEPKLTNFVFTWVVYFEDDVAHVQNNIIFLDEVNDFTPDKINDFIDKRSTHDEDGMKISQWSTDIKNILDFYNSLNH